MVLMTCMISVKSLRPSSFVSISSFFPDRLCGAASLLKQGPICYNCIACTGGVMERIVREKLVGSGLAMTHFRMAQRAPANRRFPILVQRYHATRYNCSRCSFETNSLNRPAARLPGWRTAECACLRPLAFRPMVAHGLALSACTFYV